MSDLEQQAASWVPPWQRPTKASAEQSKPDNSSTPYTSVDDDEGTEASAPAPRPGGSSDDDHGWDEAEGPDDGADATDGSAAAAPRSRAGESGTAQQPGAGVPEAAGESEDGRPAAGGRRAASEDAGSGHAAGAPEAADGAPSDGEGAAPGGGRGGKKGRGGKPKGPRTDAVVDMLAAAAVPGQRGPADVEGTRDPFLIDDRPPLAVSEAELVPALEAILMVVDEPVSEILLSQVLDIEAEHLANTLIDMAATYTREGRGFDLRRAAGGWRIYTRAEYASYVERFVLDGQQLRLTQASLETLAVVAYKQPVTRSRISAIRGVNCDGVIRTLVTRGMVEECGADPESGAHLYRTTSLFLEKMGLDSVAELPPLAPFLPDNLEEIAAGE